MISDVSRDGIGQPGAAGAGRGLELRAGQQPVQQRQTHVDQVDRLQTRV
ncbi:MAG: hypothetical protein ACR2RB_02400 [Gammaproteobacteria bacterium]